LWCYSDDNTGERYWNQTADFSRIVFFFLFFSIFLAIVNFYTSYDTAYPGAFVYIAMGVVFLLSAYNGADGPGWFYLAGATNHNYFCSGDTYCWFARVIDNWILFGHFFMLALIYFFTTNKRYQAG